MTSLQQDKSPLSALSLNQSGNLRQHEFQHASEAKDRFIPKKICANLYNLYFADESSKKCKENQDSNQPEFKDRLKDKYDEILKAQLLGDGARPVLPDSIENSKSKQKRLVNFGSENKKKKLDSLLMRDLNVSPTHTQESSNKIPRKIAKSPYKVLEAPGILEDYYLNLMDWSSTNLIGIGLQNIVYFWSATNSKVTK